MAEKIDILVAGTGPAGLISALAFATAGFSVILAGPSANRADGRTTALMAPALEFLGELALLPAIADVAAPLKVMRIVDATSRLVRSPVVTFHASEIDEPHFGLNIPNRDLNRILEEFVEATPAIIWHKALAGRWSSHEDHVSAQIGDVDIHAQLAVAADGRDSPAREAAGIVTTTRRQPQSALALTFTHTQPHSFISTEFHTETGPFTQVPLPGDRSSLVWVVTPEQADELASLPLAALSQQVEARMQSMLGGVSVEAAPQIYPLTSRLPSAFASNRVALVGEAAHTFPPIGAQGLNLGIRDIEQLLVLSEEHRGDPGAEGAMRLYDRKRRPDILARSGAVNLLNGSLLSTALPAQMIRSAGLGALGAFAPLRSFFMREGLKPGSGFGAIGSMLREQIRG